MKLKRLLTGVLSAVMALSVCAMPALADEATNKQVTFDPAKEFGSLTIMKYEQTSAEAQENPVNNRKALNDVEFTIYQIAEIEQKEVGGQIQLSYNWKTNKLNDSVFTGVAEKDGKIDSGKLYEAISGKLDKTDLSSLKNYVRTTGTVDASDTGHAQKDGEAYFGNLPLGIYMVSETKAPAQILTYTANFIVSIPMVQDGQWIYDVKAEPKNAPTYGGVSLKKTGVTVGNATESPVADVMFRLDKKGSNGTWSAVDVSGFTFTAGKMSDDTDKPATGGFVITDANGMITISSGLTKGDYRFVEISAAHGYIANTAEDANCFTVDEKDGELVTKVNNVEVSAVEVKNERPDFDKDVTLRGENGANQSNDADYGIGDLIPYTLTVKVPETIANLKTFYVTDSINTDNTEQLAYEKDTFTVSCSGDVDIVKNINYTIAFEKDGSGFKIDFKPDGETGLTEDFAGKTITITYKAKLQSGAYVDRNGNINNAELIYSNKTNTVTDESKDIDKIHDEAVVYTFQTSIMKTGSDGAKLDGVKFDLYKKYDETTDGMIKNGSITFRNEPCPVIDGEAAYKLKLNSIASSADKWILVKKDMTTAGSGAAIEKGLPKGDYYLVETETNAGYNLLSEPVKADLSIDYVAKWTENKEYTNGVLTKHTYDKATTEFDDAAAVKIINIVNRKGFTLPVTGGFGTLLFSGIGVLLVLAGVCVLFSMKKKNNRA